MVSGVEAPAASALRPGVRAAIAHKRAVPGLLGLPPVARTAHFALHRLPLF
jgi:hypothetical protein